MRHFFFQYHKNVKIVVIYYQNSLCRDNYFINLQRYRQNNISIVYMEKIDKNYVELVTQEIMRKVQNEDDVKDIQQEVFYKWHNKTQNKEFQTEGQKRLYLRKIARTMAVDFVRKKQKEKSVRLDDLTDEMFLIEDDDTMINYELEAILKLVSAPEKDKKVISYVIEQVYFERRSRRSVAKELHMSFKRLHKLLSEFFVKFKEQTQKEFDEEHKWNP